MALQASGSEDGSTPLVSTVFNPSEWKDVRDYGEYIHQRALFVRPLTPLQKITFTGVLLSGIVLLDTLEINF